MRLPSSALVSTVLCSMGMWVCSLSWGGGGSEENAQTVAFGVHWPPRNPTVTSAPRTRTLLDGLLTLQVRNRATNGWMASIQVVLSRATNEAGREFWNSRLAFPEYDWMSSVRVWDADHRWLWPNLACLLTLHGRERVDRYGGVDPGKGVDNDFAAVLIRKYDGSGEQESDETKSAPLVSADWRPDGGGKVDRLTVVHTVQSDAFTLHLGRPGTKSDGHAGIWLVYADFLGATPPSGWPREPEFAGGILAYFEVRWRIGPGGDPDVRVQHLVPPRATGFDWQRWTLRTLASPDPRRTATLSDRSAP